jgi:hypothetical protein
LRVLGPVSQCISALRLSDFAPKIEVCGRTLNRGTLDQLAFGHADSGDFQRDRLLCKRVEGPGSGMIAACVRALALVTFFAKL